MLEKHQLAPRVLAAINTGLAQGLMLKTGTIVDATITAAPSSTKNKEGKLAKYKMVAAAIKTYLGAVGTGSIYESLVWGQRMLHESGGVPKEIPNLGVENLTAFPIR